MSTKKIVLNTFNNRRTKIPRLSMWRENKSADYKFFDRTISEQFTIGGTGIFVHKYLGPDIEQGVEGDATQPQYATQSEKNIQDLLFLENRDRKYDTSIYAMRGIYQLSDKDFDLSQFGLFLSNDTIFMVFHLNDMIDTLGRKIMNGDVLELLHLKDYDVLDESIPAALKRYYVVSDASRASEGYSPTWYPHLWRVKLGPLVDSQEYKGILKQIQIDDGTGSGNTTPISDIMSTYNQYMDINQAIIQQAEVDLPKSGYDTSVIYHKPVKEDGTMGDVLGVTADNYPIDASAVDSSADSAPYTPRKKVQGYLTGDGLPPNGLPVGAGVAFPQGSAVGDYYLRLDYLPNRLFRFDGKRWVKVEDSVRTNLTPGNDDNRTLRSTFLDNDNTYVDSNGNTQPEQQGLSKALKPKADN